VNVQTHSGAVFPQRSRGNGRRFAEARVVYCFHARDLHLVMESAGRGTSVRFRVLVDEHPTRSRSRHRRTRQRRGYRTADVLADPAYSLAIPTRVGHRTRVRLSSQGATKACASIEVPNLHLQIDRPLTAPGAGVDRTRLPARRSLPEFSERRLPAVRRSQRLPSSWPRSDIEHRTGPAAPTPVNRPSTPDYPRRA
jgi:hypothetical protein